MIENIVQKRKNFITQKAETQKKKLDFIANEFYKNKTIFESYITRNKLSPEQAYDELNTIINFMSPEIGLGSRRGDVRTKDHLHIMLGYYKIQNEGSNADNHSDILSLELTEKGKKIHEEYLKISSEF